MFPWDAAVAVPHRSARCYLNVYVYCTFSDCSSVNSLVLPGRCKNEINKFLFFFFLNTEQCDLCGPPLGEKKGLYLPIDPKPGFIYLCMYLCIYLSVPLSTAFCHPEPCPFRAPTWRRGSDAASRPPSPTSLPRLCAGAAGAMGRVRGAWSRGRPEGGSG